MGTSLNKPQQVAVNHIDGPMLVVAGAGTGKTKVIVERIAKLIESGIEKKQILALTFTEKAAQEMLDRTSELLHESYGVELNIYTFNAFGHELLREFAIEVGLSANLQLVGDNGKIVLLKEHLDELELDYFAPISRPDRQLADIAGYFSKLKQQLVKPLEYETFVTGLKQTSDEERFEKKRHSELAHAFKTYLDITRENNVIDYDDQLYLLTQLLELRPNVLKKLQERYRYIMIDEFQDTNPLQSRLVDLLAGKQKNIFAVGDDDQSIYGWRGATLSNILEFTQRYSTAKEVTLIENFRSTQGILDSAWRLIQYNNPNRLEVINKLDKKLRAYRGGGSGPQIHKFSRLDAELNWVAEDIQQRLSDGVPAGQIAVLARSKNSVSRMHQMLETTGIEHVVAGVTNDLYKHPMIATMVEALKAVTDPNDNTALFHVLSSNIFGCDIQVLSSLSSQARREHESLEVMLTQSENESFKSALDLLSGWRQRAATVNVRSLSYDILSESGLKDRLLQNAESSVENSLAAQALGQWFSTLVDFEQVSSLPSAVNYLINLPALQAEGETISDETVNFDETLPIVMTAHKAKGLEWSVVYIIDCTEQSFPIVRRSQSLEVPDELAKTTTADDHYAEERRLMYVAMTRARDELIVTHSESHNGVTTRRPSRFIEELSGQTDGKSNGKEKLVGIGMFQPGDGLQKTVSLPKRMRRNGSLVLTASQADDYLRCGLNFYYKHVLCVPEPPNAATVVGSSFHDCLQQLNEAKLNGTEFPSLESLRSRLEKAWPFTGYSSKIQRERALKHGLAAFELLYERIRIEPVPLAVEEAFDLRIPDSRLILNGRIDVVMPAGKGVEIRDYKTSTSTDTPEKAKTKTSSSTQLTMYALAWRLLYDEDPVQVALDFVQTGQVGVVKKRADSLDKLQTALVQAAEDILAGKFPPGNKHDFCIHPL